MLTKQSERSKFTEHFIKQETFKADFALDRVHRVQRVHGHSAGGQNNSNILHYDAIQFNTAVKFTTELKKLNI